MTLRRLVGRYFTRGVKNTNMLTVSPVYKPYLTPVKTTFGVWCLFNYLVHGQKPNTAMVAGGEVKTTENKIHSALLVSPMDQITKKSKKP